MNRRVVPIFDARATPLPVSSEQLDAGGGLVSDQRGRHINDLRISVTDRCNFRCQYCMPRAVFDSNYKFLPQKALLDFDETTRLARLFVEQGVRKLRLTGGEPLLRRNLEILIEQLARLKTPDGEAVEVTLTTNASLLAKKAATLKAAGLARVTVSLDALDDAIFRRMNDADFAVADVLAGIDQAARVGLGPIKINMVVQRGVNEGEVDAMLARFRGTPHIVRFIEYMDVGTTNGWELNQVVPTIELLAKINQRFPIEPLAPSYPGEVAARWRYLDGQGEIGVITSVSQPFCADCTRARLSTEGKLYTCLFATAGTDLRELLRAGASDAAITSTIRSVWHMRGDHYSEIRTAETVHSRKKVEMSYIGG